METRIPQQSDASVEQEPSKLDWSFCHVSLALYPFDWSIKIGPNNNFGMRCFSFEIGPIHLYFSGPLEVNK